VIVFSVTDLLYVDVLQHVTARARRLSTPHVNSLTLSTIVQMCIIGKRNNCN